MTSLPVNPHMFKQNNPYRSRHSRLAEQLIANGTSTAPVQHWMQGAGRLAQALIGGYMQGQEDKDRNAATAAMLRGLTAKPWQIPAGEKIHTTAPPDEFSPGYGGYEGETISHAEARSNEASTGGFSGALAALMAEGNNPHAQQLATQFAIQDIVRKQQREDKAVDRDNAFTYQRALKGSPGWVPPKAPKPGVDVPLSDDVFNQRKALSSAGAPKTFGTIPPGYQLVPTPDGKGQMMVPIPGSPAAAKAAEREAKTAGQNETRERYSNIVLEDIGRVREKIIGAPWYSPTTGFAGDVVKNVGGSRAHDISGMLDTIKANVGFDRLQEMRNNSPTGGALGQVSEQENRLLQSTLGSVIQSQSEAQLLSNLARLENVYLDIVHGKGNRPMVDSRRNAPKSQGNGIPINSPRTGGSASSLTDEQVREYWGIQ